MKKLVLLSLIFLALLVQPAFAQQAVYNQPPLSSRNSYQTQVTCDGTARQLYNGQRLSITLENFTAATVPVFIGTIPGLTVTNGGIQLAAALMTWYIDDSGQDDWYCITAGGTATVGVMVRK